MSRFVYNRYTVIDHSNAQLRKVGLFVLEPAGNPADYAAMVTRMENSDPEMAADIRKHLDLIDKHPERGLTSQGREVLEHIRHPAIIEFAKKRLEALK